MDQEYFVLSLKYSRGVDFLVWWKPKDAGYTSALENAGRYTEEQQIKKEFRNDGVNTRAVKCTTAEKLSHRVVSIDHLDLLSL